jgi:LysM repeat protein
MAPPTLHPKWIKTVNDGVTNKAWDAYDALIKAEVADCNVRLAGTPGFAAFDWLMFKAVLWVESGGPSSPAWTTRPMQIGNAGDAGYAVLKGGKEAAPLVMSEALKKDIKTGSISTPALNVRAGIAYALTRLAKSEIRSVDDPADAKVYQHTAVKGDSPSSIAKQVGSTLEVIRELNPGALNLQIGQKLKYRKASMQRVLIGWHPLTTANLALRYNAGDSTYAQKLKYVLDLFPTLVR